MKKFYKENRVFVILMGIALVCIAIIIFMLATYVLNSTKNDKYGNRLDGISDVEVKADKVTEMEEAILEMPKVEDVTINIHGKIINFNVYLESDANVEEAQNIGISSLEFFDEDYLNFYDLQFLISKKDPQESESNFPVLGYRKGGTTQISWSNNSKK